MEEMECEECGETDPHELTGCELCGAAVCQTCALKPHAAPDGTTCPGKD